MYSQYQRTCSFTTSGYNNEWQETSDALGTSWNWKVHSRLQRNPLYGREKVLQRGHHTYQYETSVVCETINVKDQNNPVDEAGPVSGANGLEAGKYTTRRSIGPLYRNSEWAIGLLEKGENQAFKQAQT